MGDKAGPEFEESSVNSNGAIIGWVGRRGPFEKQEGGTVLPLRGSCATVPQQCNRGFLLSRRTSVARGMTNESLDAIPFGMWTLASAAGHPSGGPRGHR